VSHNMNIIRHVSDKIMVLKKGQLIEKATTEQLFNSPQHEYTQRLIQEQSLFTRKK
jgi:cationic peptide transport system ATP-binding protein